MPKLNVVPFAQIEPKISYSGLPDSKVIELPDYEPSFYTEKRKLEPKKSERSSLLPRLKLSKQLFTSKIVCLL